MHLNPHRDPVKGPFLSEAQEVQEPCPPAVIVELGPRGSETPGLYRGSSMSSL